MSQTEFLFPLLGFQFNRNTLLLIFASGIVCKQNIALNRTDSTKRSHCTFRISYNITGHPTGKPHKITLPAQQVLYRSRGIHASLSRSIHLQGILRQTGITLFRTLFRKRYFLASRQAQSCQGKQKKQIKKVSHGKQDILLRFEILF